MHPRVILHIQLTEAVEVARALRWQFLRNRRSLVIPIVGLVLVVCGVIVLTSSGGSPGAGLGMLGVGAYFLLLFAFVIWRAPTRSWRRTPAIREPRTMTFSDEGIEGQTALSESRSQWGLLKESYENDAFFMLRLASRKSLSDCAKAVHRFTRR